MTLALEGVDNFRDIGARVRRPGRLFRSAHLAAATSSDIAALRKLDLVAVVDLRRPSERKRDPSPPDICDIVIASDDGDRAEAPHLEFLRQGDTSDAAVDKFLLDYYRNAPFEPRHLTLFSQAFLTLDRGPILIHCTAGKDRTGLLAALILSSYGAGFDGILRDFLLTNRAMLKEPYIGRARALGRQLMGQEPSSRVVHAMLGVQASFLEAAFQSIVDTSGSVASYLAELRKIA